MRQVTGDAVGTEVPISGAGVPGSVARVRHLLPALALVPLLAGCSGQSCDGLDALRAERDAARQDYQELVGPGTVSPERAEEADDALHALERRVYDLEQSCD